VNPINSGLGNLDQIKGTLIDLAIRFGPKLLTAALIMTAGVFVAGWIARGTARGLHRLDLEPPLQQLLTRVVRVLVLGLFFIMALQNLGVELLPLIAGIGVAGAGIVQLTTTPVPNA
jgi:small conductance mechanosensitive channel